MITLFKNSSCFELVSRYVSILVKNFFIIFTSNVNQNLGVFWEFDRILAQASLQEPRLRSLAAFDDMVLTLIHFKIAIS